MLRSLLAFVAILLSEDLWVLHGMGSSNNKVWQTRLLLRYRMSLSAPNMLLTLQVNVCSLQWLLLH